jgi:hypothetical protein
MTTAAENGSGWVLPEKFEEGLLDENGQPLSKRYACQIMLEG